MEKHPLNFALTEPKFPIFGKKIKNLQEAKGWNKTASINHSLNLEK